MELLTLISVMTAAASVLICVFVIRRVKARLNEMLDALADIKAGNGSRRILSTTDELTAPIAYEINDIVSSYEKKLAAFRRTQGTNRQLMTSLSHDVRTPLTTLIGYLDAAHRGLVSGREKDDSIETARRKAYDLKEYIDALFDWFKLNSDEFILTMDTVEAAELTRNILIDWIPVLEEKRIDYQIHIPEQPFRVRLDPDAYLRILNNLIQNVIVHSHADRMELSLSARDGKLILLVADNGVGMEREDLKHIFERLYKCDKGRSEKGSGLGLSIVKEVIQAHDEHINVISTEGVGTEFIFSLSRAN